MTRWGRDQLAVATAAGEPRRWRLGPGVRWLGDTTLAGGNPVRIVTMTNLGAQYVRHLLAGNETAAAGPVVDALFQRLEGAGFLVPPVATPTHHNDVTLVVPALSTPAQIRKLLQYLPADLRVVIIDDGSPQSLVGLESERANLTVRRHDRSRGPAAARNTGAAIVDTTWIAFLDADTQPDPDWIAALRAQIDQSDTSVRTGPRIVLAAPRIYPLPGPGLGGWFDQRVVALDLGAVASDIGIGRVVPYVPSAALLVDRKAFEMVGGFDESMQVGEDVDLVWRLAALGRLCYYPHVSVGHTPRSSLLAALNRRRVYGWGSADLSVRHPGAVRHLEVSIWTFGPWLLAITVNPVLGFAAAISAGAVAHFRLRKLSAAAHAHRFAAWNHLRAAGMLGRWLMRPLLPLSIALGVISPRVRPRLIGAVGAGLVYLASLDLRNTRNAAGPTTARFRLAVESVLARTLDDAAYSVGVWQGVLSRRNLDPVLPRLRGVPERWRRRDRHT